MWLGNGERNFYGTGPWQDGQLKIVWDLKTEFMSGRLHKDPWGGTSWPGQPSIRDGRARGGADRPTQIDHAGFGQRDDAPAPATAGQPRPEDAWRADQPVDEVVECRGRHLLVVAQAVMRLRHEQSRALDVAAPQPAAGPNRNEQITGTAFAGRNSVTPGMIGRTLKGMRIAA